MSGFIQLVIQFVLLLNFFGLSNAYHNLPNPWFLHSSKSLPFATREQVVETVFLDNGTSFALTAQNGTRNFALYRQLGPASNIDRAKLALSNTTNWIYDGTRVSSAVSFTIEPTNQTFCIFFLNKTNIGVQWFSPAELQWNSSATISNTNLWTGNSFKSIDYPNIELSWRNADIFFAVYSFNCTTNSSACTGHFINRFSYTGNFTVQSAYVKSNVAHSIEFDCPQCQAKARIISPGEINYVALSDLSLVLGPTVTESQQVGPNSVRAYSSNGDTFYAFMLPHPSNPGKVAVYLQQNSGTDNFVDRIQLEPSIPQSLASQRLAIAVNVNYIVVAFVTDKISIQSNWHGVWYNSVQGEQDSNMEVVVAEINRANFLPSAMLIFSTKGNDTVVNVDIGLDRRITIMGTTEGHVSSPSTSTNLNMNGAFVVAKFQPFIIDKVLSVVTGIDIEEGEVVDSSNFTVTFKPVPLGMSIYDHPSVYFDTLQCTSSMLNTTTLIVTPPIILNTANEAQFVARAFKLSIEMSMLPYAPKVERIIAHQLPVVIDIMPKTLKSDDTIKTLNVTIKYLGPLYLNYLAIFITFDQIPNKKYDCTKKPPNNIQLLNDNGTILPCSIGGVAPGRGQFILSFNSLNATTNVLVDFSPNADDLKITLSDFRDREVMLNCRAFDASMDTLIFHVQNNLSTTIAQLRQRNDIQIPVGDDTILPNQNSFKVRRNSPDVAGVFPIPWYCADSLDIVKSTPAKLEITFLPAANCQMNQAVKNMFVLDNVRSNLTYLNMSIVFRTVPEFGKLIDSQNADISLLAGSIYDKPSVKYRVDKTIQSASSGSFSYHVEQNGLQSDICNVAFTIACAPLYLNIFDNSTDALCVPCPVGANCEFVVVNNF
ncbi:hypothetical protein BKA69DRAFT_720189 [Paraphysoderma sedebokerense]|nr:hypothetical protein BKA69DRAFT_720189 [Paraphysoderma sedebokerense]